MTPTELIRCQTHRSFDNIGLKSIITLTEQTVISFEQVFRDTEQAADSTRESSRRLGLQAGTLARAAKTGNVAAIRRAQDRLRDALDELRQEVANASSSWTLAPESEEQYLADGYAEELINAASEIKLDIYERDGNLISYPSIVRILPGERAVRVDRKKESNIRPSHLAGLLLKNQQKSSSFSSARFLESLYGVYSDIVSGESSDRMVGGSRRVVPLARIYSLLTSLPGSNREYDRTDFGRDIYILESEGPLSTRRGAVVSFPSSTGTRRRSRDLFSFIGPDGQGVEYYGIRFTEEG